MRSRRALYPSSCPTSSSLPPLNRHGPRIQDATSVGTVRSDCGFCILVSLARDRVAERSHCRSAVRSRALDRTVASRDSSVRRSDRFRRKGRFSVGRDRVGRAGRKRERVVSSAALVTLIRSGRCVEADSSAPCRHFLTRRTASRARRISKRCRCVRASSDPTR